MVHAKTQRKTKGAKETPPRGTLLAQSIRVSNEALEVELRLGLSRLKGGGLSHGIDPADNSDYFASGRGAGMAS